MFKRFWTIFSLGAPEEFSRDFGQQFSYIYKYKFRLLVYVLLHERLQFFLFHKETRHLSSERECLRSQASSERRRRGLQWVALLRKIFENVLKRCFYCSWNQTNSFHFLQAHWDGMLNLWNDYHCKIKEKLFIQQLKPLCRHHQSKANALLIICCFIYSLSRFFLNLAFRNLITFVLMYVD